MSSKPSTENTSQRLLAYASQRLGKVEMAARLNVSVDTLDAWVAGDILIAYGSTGYTACVRSWISPARLPQPPSQHATTVYDTSWPGPSERPATLSGAGRGFALRKGLE